MGLFPVNSKELLPSDPTAAVVGRTRYGENGDALRTPSGGAGVLGAACPWAERRRQAWREKVLAHVEWRGPV